MKNEIVKSKKSFQVGIVLVMCIFWLVDAVLMFFNESILMYFLISLPVIFIITSILFKFKRQLMEKEIGRLRAFLIVFGVMLLNIGIDVVHTMYF